MFPDRQDISTHKSSASKRARREGANTPTRTTITTPKLLSDAFIEAARKKYRQGDTVLVAEVRVFGENFLEWAKQDQAADTIDQVDRRLMLTRVHKAAKQLAKGELSPGTFVISDSVQESAKDAVIFTLVIKPINPAPSK